MTPRSPRELKRGSSSANFVNNPLEKWIDEDKEVTILFATSNDERFPADNVLNKEENTFWATTGCFPQEIVIALKNETRISEIRTVSSNVRSISIERVMPKKTPTSQGPPDWKEVLRTELPVDTIDHLQIESHKMNNVSVKFLKVKILSGFDSFVAVYGIQICTTDGKWLC